MNQIEDIFLTPEFKSLPFRKKLWIRIKVAFITFISYY